VRNPRVKKRQKFAKAKKVIASQKPVFKPGAGDSTWYGGERSGISTVVKSVQL
jgi:U3 small nucleolar RNA-associated protein 3